MPKKTCEVTLEDFADLFGTTVEDIPGDCRELIERNDFRYKTITGEKRDQVILDILKKIDSAQLTTVGAKRKSIWEKGWNENLQNFLDKHYDIDELKPKYYRPSQILRYRQDYVTAIDPDFEFNFFKVLRLWLFRKYLKDVKTIYEFGCGPGHNLVALAKLFPEKEIHGLDWVKSSCELVNKIAEVYHHNITGHIFDMFHPDESLNIQNNSAILTIGALEQLGRKFEAFLQFQLKKNPTLCLNVEPFLELYNQDNLADYLAVKYQDKRNYLAGYLERLQQLKAEGKIEILKTHRMLFGSYYYDGWSFVIWRPKKT